MPKFKISSEALEDVPIFVSLVKREDGVSVHLCREGSESLSILDFYDDGRVVRNTTRVTKKLGLRNIMGRYQP